MFGQKNKKTKLSAASRFPIFVIAMIACFTVAILKLINYQIIDADRYVMEAKTDNLSKQKIPVARGEIKDRHGVTMASNQLNLSLIIGEAFPYPNSQDNKKIAAEKNEKGNKILSKLIDILEENDVEFDKKFPITKHEPFEFIEDRKFEERKLKIALNQQPYATPTDVIELLKEKYNIYDYGTKKTRDIAAIRANMLVSGFSYNKTFALIEKIEPDLMQKITGIKNFLTGIDILETSTRYYPCNDVCAQIIGHVGAIFEEEVEKYKSKGYSPNDIVGKEGIERTFEETLRGFAGTLVTERDREQNIINQYYMEGKEPKPGKNVILTIDFKFQQKLQEKLAEFLTKHPSKGAKAAKGAALVVLDVKTGEILADISLPTYDINSKIENYSELLKTKNNPLRDRANCELYRPGSTFKPFMAASALIEGVITTSTKYPCSKSNIFPRMGCMQDSHHGSHSIGFFTAIQRSCNNYFYAVARDLGIEKINEYAPFFGFGQDNGLEIRNEKGRVTNPQYYKEHGQQYSIGHLYQTGIGQAGVKLTIVELASYAATIANKGIRFATHIIKSIESYDGSEIFEKTTPKILSKLSNKNDAFDHVETGMKKMAQTRAPLKGYDGFALKSGSPENRENSKITDSAAIGYWPTSNPKIAFALIIEDGGEAPDFCKEIVDAFNTDFL